MSGFRLTARAVDDLREIGRYTERIWGRQQRDEYLSKIDAAFHLLGRSPEAGQACDEIRTGYRRYRVGRHFIFYRVEIDIVEVIRILHERMNVEDRLF